MPSLIFKYVIIGDTDVGKSSLLLQFLEEKFNPTHRMTIGVEYGLKPAEICGKDIKIEIWDTAGQECYQALTRQYYRNADGCLIVFDLTRRGTFENVSKWAEHAHTHTNNPHLVITLVGNKADCEEKRQVARAEAEALAAHHGFQYREITAKDSVAVKSLFHSTAEKIYRIIEGKGESENGGVCIDGAGRIRLTSLNGKKGGMGGGVNEGVSGGGEGGGGGCC